MKNIYRTAALALTLAALSGGARAQRARTVSDPAAADTQASAKVVVPKPAPAPAAVKAKYEGGLVGYRKSDGTLSFDDENRRLTFRDKKQKELFSVSYDVINAAWADTRSQTATAGSVIASTMPYGLGLPGLLIRNKYRYLKLQYKDPDTNAEGITVFKLSSKELLASVLGTVADKAGLTQRGEAYVRRKQTPAPAADNNPD